jgi:hypothetical protein
MATKITDNYFEFGNQKYFRGNAHLVQIGTHGEKKDPIGARAYLDPQSMVRSEYLDSRVQTGTVATVDWGQTTKATVEVNGLLKFFGLNGKIDTKGTYEMAKNAHLKLANFFILEGRLKDMLNTDADGARYELANEGNDGRIVGEVWVAMEAELAEHFEMYGKSSLSVTAKGAELEMTVTGGKHGSQTISLSPGTTFAYKLYKVKNWSNNKTHIDDLEADYKGMG